MASKEDALIKIRCKAESLEGYCTKFDLMGRAFHESKNARIVTNGFIFTRQEEERVVRFVAAWPGHFGLRIADVALIPKRTDRVT